LIFLKYKSQVFLIFHILMSFQLTSLRYYQVAQAKKQTHFIENSKKMKFQPNKGFEKPCF
jgi:hypothetical protein